MGPEVELFPASELASRVQYDERGKKRKQPVDLDKCQLKELVQYKCDVDEKHPQGAVRCWPLIRTFRQYVKFFDLIISSTSYVYKLHNY